jgi:hypothetical protein
MNKAEISPEQLRQAAFERVAECRQALAEGRADLSGLEHSVRGYCAAVAQLPEGQGRLHEPELKKLMLEVEALGIELAGAHDVIRKELEGLGRLKQANVAYHKSYAIGPAKIPKSEEE